MLSALIFYCFCLANNFTDTLVHPLHGGKVQTIEKRTVLHPDLAAEIFPTDSYTVTSCSKGHVFAIRQYPDGRWMVIVRSDTLSFAYQLDTVFVSQYELIDKGTPIGKLKQVFAEDEAAQDFPLVFFVLLRAREVYARRYLIFEHSQ